MGENYEDDIQIMKTAIKHLVLLSKKDMPPPIPTYIFLFLYILLPYLLHSVTSSNFSVLQNYNLK